MAAFVAAMLTASGARLDILPILGLLSGGTVIAASGYVLVLWTRAESSSEIAMAILLGSIATSLFLTGGCLLSGYSAGTIFLWWSVLVVAISFRAFWRVSPFDTVNPARLVRGVDLRDLASTVSIAVVVAVWCRRSASLLPTLRATGLAPIWSDYFIHGTVVAQFGVPLAEGRSSFLLIDQPLVFYHYASYMLPAAVARLVDLPALGLATSVLLPYGILLAALGMYAFVKTIAGQGIALLAPMALLMLPDASTVGFRNGFFGFHWLLFTAPGSGYGLGVAFTALTLMAIWRADKRKASLWLGLTVTAALFEFRAHIFILLAPALAMTLLWETDLVRRHARVIASAMLVATVTGVVCVAAVPVARQAWLQFSAFGPFIEGVHTCMSPTAYDGTYRMIEQEYGRASAWIIGFWALIPIALGGLTIALPLALMVAVRRTGWQRFDSFPIWCVAAWLAVVVCAPRAPTETLPSISIELSSSFMRRPSFGRSCGWIARCGPSALPGLVRGASSSSRRSSSPFLVQAWPQAGTRISARPHFAWGSRHFGTRLDRGLLEAATFVRTQAVVGDTFALIPTDQWNQADDAATRFAALANVPAYLGARRDSGAQRSRTPGVGGTTSGRAEGDRDNQQPGRRAPEASNDRCEVPRCAWRPRPTLRSGRLTCRFPDCRRRRLSNRVKAHDRRSNRKSE